MGLMEGLGTVFGVIALLVALAALWFVNDVVRRIERQNQQFLDAHLRGLREAIEGCAAKLGGLERKADDAAGRIADVQKKGEALDKVQNDHDGQLKALRDEMERLHRQGEPR
jgi:phage shock protein A